MDKQVMIANVSVFDKANRLVSGSLLLLALLATPSAPAWLMLIPLYPILTAIAAWDPFYAAFHLAQGIITEKLSFKGSKLALG